VLVRLRAWFGYGKLDSPTSPGRSEWTPAERKEARKQIAAEELDAWRSSGDKPPEGPPGQVTAERIEESAPVVETEEEARQRLLDGLPRRRRYRPPDPPRA
jgi:hypothetical protein